MLEVWNSLIKRGGGYSLIANNNQRKRRDFVISVRLWKDEIISGGTIANFQIVSLKIANKLMQGCL